MTICFFKVTLVILTISSYSSHHLMFEWCCQICTLRRIHVCDVSRGQIIRKLFPTFTRCMPCFTNIESPNFTTAQDLNVEMKGEKKWWTKKKKKFICQKKNEIKKRKIYATTKSTTKLTLIRRRSCSSRMPSAKFWMYKTWIVLHSINASNTRFICGPLIFGGSPWFFNLIILKS